MSCYVSVPLLAVLIGECHPTLSVIYVLSGCTDRPVRIKSIELNRGLPRFFHVLWLSCGHLITCPKYRTFQCLLAARIPFRPAYVGLLVGRHWFSPWNSPQLPDALVLESLYEIGNGD